MTAKKTAKKCAARFVLLIFSITSFRSQSSECILSGTIKLVSVVLCSAIVGRYILQKTVVECPWLIALPRKTILDMRRFHQQNRQLIDVTTQGTHTEAHISLLEVWILKQNFRLHRNEQVTLFTISFPDFVISVLRNFYMRKLL